MLGVLAEVASNGVVSGAGLQSSGGIRHPGRELNYRCPTSGGGEVHRSSKITDLTRFVGVLRSGNNRPGWSVSDVTWDAHDIGEDRSWL